MSGAATPPALEHHSWANKHTFNTVAKSIDLYCMQVLANLAAALASSDVVPSTNWLTQFMTALESQTVTSPPASDTSSSSDNSSSASNPSRPGLLARVGSLFGGSSGSVSGSTAAGAGAVVPVQPDACPALASALSRWSPSLGSQLVQVCCVQMRGDA